MTDELLAAIARMIIALPIVAALAYFALKYGLGKRYMGLQKHRRMRVIEQVSLGPKSTMSLVQVGGKYYLLAHQQDGSTVLIKEMDDLPEEIQQGGNTNVTSAGSFSSLYQKWLQRRKFPWEKDKHE